MKHIVFKNKREEKSPSFNRLRRNNYSMNMAKEIVLSKKEMEKSLEKVRRNIRFITGVNERLIAYGESVFERPTDIPIPEITSEIKNTESSLPLTPDKQETTFYS